MAAPEGDDEDDDWREKLFAPDWCAKRHMQARWNRRDGRSRFSIGCGALRRAPAKGVREHLAETVKHVPVPAPRRKAAGAEVPPVNETVLHLMPCEGTAREKAKKRKRTKEKKQCATPW